MDEEFQDKIDYEVSCLLRSENSLDEVIRLLGQHRAEIISAGPTKRVALAYKIEKESSAFFGFVYFRSAPDSLPQIERDLSTNGFILRFLLLRLPPSRKIPESPRPVVRPLRRGTPAREIKAAPLSNEALEKKIEEILQ